MRAARGVGLAATFALLTTTFGAEPDSTSGWQNPVVFSAYSPLSRTSEMLRRLFSPLQVQRTLNTLSRRGQAVGERSIDLAHEQFGVYVPSTRPRDGYAVLVFIPPWEGAWLPSGWASAFDRHGMIFVTAANSGNAAGVLDRREPLALLAAHNIMQRYQVDPARVYIGGYSGGARVALRIALGYPDLFRGALLNAGSDPIGTAEIPLPPVELMHEFQESTRVVYLTGRDDKQHVEMDAHSQRSLQAWCVFDVKTISPAWLGHETISAAALDSALNALEQHAPAPSDKIATCRRDYERELDQELRAVSQLPMNSRNAATKELLDKIDAHYGGLAAPRTIELTNQLDAPEQSH
jgi:hypothetical protein